VLLFVLALACLAVAGCTTGGAKPMNVREVGAQYGGLIDQRVAVVVHAASEALEIDPHLPFKIAARTSARLQQMVPGVQVTSVEDVAAWMKEHGGASYTNQAALEALDVDRLVVIDVAEYRLHPEGDETVWFGVCEADIGVLERETAAAGVYAASYTMRSEYPEQPAPKERATPRQDRVRAAGGFRPARVLAVLRPHRDAAQRVLIGD
jgi:hypothetical protein